MFKHVALYVRTCEICQRVKPSPSSEAPLQSLPISQDYWSSVSMDFIFGFPKDSHGRSGVLVFVDRLSKMVHLCAVRSKVTAPESARLFYDHVFALHGMPHSIVSDRDPRFTAHFWRALFTLLGSKLAMSTSDHPESDGQTERANRVVEDMLRSYAQAHPKDWSSHLSSVEFSINNATHASTGYSPFYLNGLRHPRLPHSVNAGVSRFVGGEWDASSRSHDPHPDSAPPRRPLKASIAKAVSVFFDTRMAVLAQVRDALAHAQDVQKRNADSKGRSNMHTFEVNDLVLLSTKSLPNEAISHALGTKLLPRFIGPFRVAAKISERSYRLELPPGLRLHPTFYVGRLKPYVKGQMDDDGRLAWLAGDASHAQPRTPSPGDGQSRPVAGLPPHSARAQEPAVGPQDQVARAQEPAADPPSPEWQGSTERHSLPGSSPDPEARSPHEPTFPSARDAPPRGPQRAATSPPTLGPRPPARSDSHAGRRGQRRSASRGQSDDSQSCPQPLPHPHTTQARAAAGYTRQPPPPALDARGNTRFLVEVLLQERGAPHTPGHQFLVKWVGYPHSQNSWEPSATLQEDVPGAILAYRRSLSSELPRRES
jgi:hypothetical protein